jgi:class 3 adenylate cyclase
MAPMQQIADWLKKLGMSEYAERFAANDIEIDILPELTDHDLERLGVSLGHRQRILRAIQELRGPAPAAPQTATVPAPAAHDSAERRQLTVMFCDLVGSTALSVKFDPEDLRGIIAGYRRCCTELVERNGGFVARYMGDGVLAYFGYPQAHEHDAERAVRAGLALVEVVPKLETVTSVPLQVRIGIATGLVVVGDLIGAGAAQEQAVESRCAAAGGCGTGHCGHRPNDSPASSRTVRVPRSRRHRGEGPYRASAGLSGGATEHGR